MSRAESSSSAWATKCSGWLRKVAFTQKGQWLSTRTALNWMRLGTGRAAWRTTRSRRPGRSRRASQAGVPSRSSGAATNVMSMCCTMCTL